MRGPKIRRLTFNTNFFCIGWHSVHFVCLCVLCVVWRWLEIAGERWVYVDSKRIDQSVQEFSFNVIEWVEVDRCFQLKDDHMYCVHTILLFRIRGTEYVGARYRTNPRFDFVLALCDRRWCDLWIASYFINMGLIVEGLLYGWCPSKSVLL